MKVFNCILGVLSLLGAVYCLVFPGRTFLTACWIVTAILLLFGICSIVAYCTTEKKNRVGIANGVVGLIIGIGATAVSVLAMFFRPVQAMLDITILYAFIAWIIIDGISTIAQAIVLKKTVDSKLWVVPLIMGILLILAGIAGLFSALSTIMAIGYLIGYLLIVYGIKLICSVAAPR